MPLGQPETLASGWDSVLCSEGASRGWINGAPKSRRRSLAHTPRSWSVASTRSVDSPSAWERNLVRREASSRDRRWLRSAHSSRCTHMGWWRNSLRSGLWEAATALGRLRTCRRHSLTTQGRGRGEFPECPGMCKGYAEKQHTRCWARQSPRGWRSPTGPSEARRLHKQLDLRVGHSVVFYRPPESGWRSSARFVEVGSPATIK